MGMTALKRLRKLPVLKAPVRTAWAELKMLVIPAHCLRLGTGIK